MGTTVHTVVCSLRRQLPQAGIILGSLTLLVVAGFGCGNEGKGRISQHISALDQPQLVSLVIEQAPDLSLGQGQLVIQGSWGSSKGQFGKRDEASRPGPMSVTVAKDQTIYILDQVNKRVARFDSSGQLMSYIPIDSEATEDIAVAGERVWALEYESGDEPGFRVTRYGKSGPEQQFKLDRAIQLVTGISLSGPADAPDVWIEQRHDGQTRVVRQGTAAVTPDELKLWLPGRPDRAISGLRLDARRMNSHSAMVARFLPGEATVLRIQVNTRLPLVAIQGLEGDQAGNVYLGLLLGRDGGPPQHQMVDVRKVMAVHCATGKTMTVELKHEMATDAFRPVTVGHDGSIYQMQTTEEGVTLRRWDAVNCGGAS